MCLYSLCVRCVYYKAGILHNFCLFWFCFSFIDCWTHRYTLAHRGSLIFKKNDRAHPYTASVLGTTQSQPFILTLDPPINFDPKGLTKQKKNTPERKRDCIFFVPILKDCREAMKDVLYVCMCSDIQLLDAQILTATRSSIFYPVSTPVTVVGKEGETVSVFSESN